MTRFKHELKALRDVDMGLGCCLKMGVLLGIKISSVTVAKVAGRMGRGRFAVYVTLQLLHKAAHTLNWR